MTSLPAGASTRSASSSNDDGPSLYEVQLLRQFMPQGIVVRVDEPIARLMSCTRIDDESDGIPTVEPDGAEQGQRPSLISTISSIWATA